jgi:adenine-specific DNA-methyltransferase
MPSLNFKGKALVQNHHLVVPFSELEPVKSRGLSKSPSLHDNLIIEGDNLKALKALLPTFHGKVKCIYIDPPYNTGNEGWIYNDKVNSPMIRDWLGKTVDRDDLTRHDKWCCMMLPRLKLLRELLTEDGAIFVSIDDNEVHHLRGLMDEVFGENNGIGELVWRSRNFSDVRPTSGLSTDHEYILAYGKNANTRLRGKRRFEGKYSNPDKDPRGDWTSCSLRGKANRGQRPNLHYDIINPNTGEVYEPNPETGWICRPETLHRKIEEGRILWPKRAGGTPREKVFLGELTSGFLGFPSVIDGIFTADGTSEIREIFGKAEVVFPKPSLLVRDLIEQVAGGPNDIVLDSFAGSGTTAHAVLALNKEEGGNRRFILCQMPYETKEQEKNKRNICEDITAKRVQRVIKGVPNATDESLRHGLGGTFSYFRLGRELEKQAILDGKDLPSYEALAGYVFWTATGEEFQPKKLKRKQWFIGESRAYDVFLLYDESLETLKDMALTLDIAKALPSVSGKQKLVFAPTKYLDQDFLDRCRITFCQLPFEIYQAAERK